MDLQEVKDIIRNELHKRASSRYEMLEFVPCTSLVSIDKNESGLTQPIPYKRWRVVAVGFTVTTSGVSTENPEVRFGIDAGDIGNADNDSVGIVTQDVNANKEFTQEDCYIYDPYDVMADAKTLHNSGTPTWANGVSPIGTWYTNINAFRCTRPNDHALSVLPFIVIEVKDE